MGARATTANEGDRGARHELGERSGTRFFALIVQAFKRFFATEASSGVVLLACATVALVWANSPWAHGYFELWETTIPIGPMQMTLHHWVNDGLMVVFFLLVGLEIKREMLVGELASVKLATLPVAAAAGGMLVPALIYLAFNAGHPGARGWGIPVATDIAFSLGVLALVGSAVPPVLRVFLAAFAIVDDIGAVLVIAFFYTATIALGNIGLAALAMLLLLALNRASVQHLVVYSAIGVGLWLAVLSSGVHATIAGVLLAATIPASGKGEKDESPLVKLEQRLHTVVAFGIMPLFALANAGVALNAESLGTLDARIVLGIILGLTLGKPIGITLASLLTARAGLAALPDGMTLGRLHGLGWLGGIGFTMSLFVASLAFPTGPLLDSAKVGVLAGSTIAGTVAFVLLRSARRPR